MNIVTCLTVLLIYHTQSQYLANKCEMCRNIVKQFEMSMADTEGLNYEGGDPVWQQKNLAVYKDSELRLHTILENICQKNHFPNYRTNNVVDECNSFLENAEDDLFEWWTNGRGQVELFVTLCIQKVQVCCPYGHFGDACLPCSAKLNPRCACNGNGTRSGTGECDCLEGYQGKDCETCSKDYFQEGETCQECAESCDRCTAREDCISCAEGYTAGSELKCVDVDECLEEPCGPQGICINIPGSYQCSCQDRDIVVGRPCSRHSVTASDL